MSGLKIMSAEVQNFKRLKEYRVDVAGRSFAIIGKNDRGKSSLIQAMLSPIDSKMLPTEPIMDGEQRAKIQVVLAGELNGEARQYTIEMYFSPSNKRGRLVIEDENGEQITSKSVVKSLLNYIRFDIFEFLRADKKTRIKILKELSGKQDILDALEKEQAEVKMQHKVLIQRIDTDETLVKNHGFTPEEIERYSKPKDTDAISQKISEISKSIEKYHSVESGIREREAIVKNNTEGIASSHKSIEQMNQEIQMLQSRIEIEKKSIAAKEQNIEAAKAEIDKGRAWLEKNSKPDIDSLNGELKEAQQHNFNHQKIQDLQQKQRDFLKLKDEAIALEGKVKNFDLQRRQILEKSQLPVKGLEFDENEIYYHINGARLPLESEQINKATLIQVGARIAMSLNRNLRVIVIEDGSLLDSETKKFILELADKEGYQVMMELVDDNENPHIEFLEEAIK